MKKIIFILTLIGCLSVTAQVSWQGGTNPEANQAGTILFNKTGTPLASYTGTLYAHIGVTLNGTAWQNVIGTWGSSAQPSFTLVSGTTYKLDLFPTIQSFFNVSSGSITKINIVIRNAAGNVQTTDLTLNVGSFQSTLVSPAENSTTILSSGSDLAVSANSTLSATYKLFRNGTQIHTTTGTTYTYTDSNLTESYDYELQVTDGTTTFSRKFYTLLSVTPVQEAMPNGMEDGINYTSDATQAILVLDAPGKDFVYAVGSFNNWKPSSAYAMKKDPTTGKFWIALTGLTSGTQYTYQYWVVDQTPTTNSPKLVKTADPYSTLVLSPYDDPWIPATSYPSIPTYPAGQEREVTVLQTGQTPYNWSTATTGFVKPNKDNLVVYEVLIRDFDANRNFQDLINRIDYFKNLNVNAIEIMPVMEFEGNESWGYNTVFHLALDKFYGTSNKFKEFIDLCHQNGIAVILDVALNHAFGRNPMVRMWMKDADGDGWGSPAADNPYFNEFSTHSYGVGNDFNHSSAKTKYYVKRVIKHWIDEYKIDGFRWDLTKGFTQNCAGNDDCTNGVNYPNNENNGQNVQDRVNVLKEYADYSWQMDPNHIVIFEHLGRDPEEQQWANYRINEGKGILMWGEMYTAYRQLIQGYSTDADITRMGHVSRGFNGKRLIGYPESHDKDRLVYQAKTYGNGGIIGNVNAAITRMSAVGAVSLLVPGPKMIWHFADLGYDDSIFTCTDGSVNTDSDATSGDCKLATKPQNQWTANWLANTTRNTVYNNWAKFIDFKQSQPVFNGNYTISPNGSNTNQRIYIWNDALLATQLKNLVILANFSNATQNITPDFPYTGTWYNLMDNSSLNVSSTSASISIEAGGFRIFGNQPSTLANDTFAEVEQLILFPNPATQSFNLSVSTQQVQVYTLTGQQVLQYQNRSLTDSYDISNLVTGIYIVKITDTQNQVSTLRLIKE